MRYEFCFLVAGVVALILCGGESFGQVDNSNEASILEAPLVNEEAWRSGDVLIEVVVNADTSEVDDETGEVRGGLYKSKKLLRLLFDFENERGACYQLQETELSNFNESDGEKNVFEDWAAINYSKEAGFAKSTTKTFGVKKTSFATFSEQSNQFLFYPPELRGFWVSNQMFYRQYEKVKSHINTQMRFPEERVSVGRDGGKITLTLKVDNKIADSVVPGRYVYEFDPVNLMPVFSEERIDVEQQHNLLIRSCKIGWKESKQGVAIPVSISAKYGGPIPGMIGFGSGGMLVEETRFHWLSFNEPIAEELVDGSQIGDKSDILPLVDLKLLGLESQLERGGNRK